MSQELLTPRQVQDQFGLTVQMLANWRWSGCGPEYIKTSPKRAGRVLYRPESIAQWLASSTVRHEGAQ